MFFCPPLFRPHFLGALVLVGVLAPLDSHENPEQPTLLCRSIKPTARASRQKTKVSEDHYPMKYWPGNSTIFRSDSKTNVLFMWSWCTYILSYHVFLIPEIGGKDSIIIKLMCILIIKYYKHIYMYIYWYICIYIYIYKFKNIYIYIYGTIYAVAHPRPTPPFHRENQDMLEFCLNTGSQWILKGSHRVSVMNMNKSFTHCSGFWQPPRYIAIL